MSEIEEIVDALHRSWKPGGHQTTGIFLASDGSFISSNDETDDLDFVFELYIKQSYKFDSAYHVAVAYHAVIIDATGFYLARDLHREQGDPEAPLFRKYGENDRLEYFSDSIDMVYSWVARVLHELRREAEGR